MPGAFPGKVCGYSSGRMPVPQIGVKNMVVRGTLRLTLAPLLSDLPVVGAVRLSFLGPPSEPTCAAVGCPSIDVAEVQLLHAAKGGVSIAAAGNLAAVEGSEYGVKPLESDEQACSPARMQPSATAPRCTGATSSCCPAWRPGSSELRACCAWMCHAPKPPARWTWAVFLAH